MRDMAYFYEFKDTVPEIIFNADVNTDVAIPDYQEAFQIVKNPVLREAVITLKPPYTKKDISLYWNVTTEPVIMDGVEEVRSIIAVGVPIFFNKFEVKGMIFMLFFADSIDNFLSKMGYEDDLAGIVAVPDGSYYISDLLKDMYPDGGDLFSIITQDWLKEMYKDCLGQIIPEILAIFKIMMSFGSQGIKKEISRSVIPVQKKHPIKNKNKKYLTRRIYTLDSVSVKKYVEEKTSERKKVEYSTEEWVRRGFLRTYKTGKTVFVHPTTVKRNKALLSNRATKKQSVYILGGDTL